MARGVVRTTGTFTFTAGMACFIAAGMACLAIALHEQFRRRFLSPAVLVICAAVCRLAWSVVVAIANVGSIVNYRQASITCGCQLRAVLHIVNGGPPAAIGCA